MQYAFAALSLKNAVLDQTDITKTEISKYFQTFSLSKLSTIEKKK